jgi:hypothetical protein
VVGDLSSGLLENMTGHVDKGRIQFRHEDLLDPIVALRGAKGIQAVFHLAVDHDGRGYDDTHSVECSTKAIF